MTENPNAQNAPSPAEAQNTESTQPGPVPYDRFAEVNNQRKAEAERRQEIEAELVAMRAQLAERQEQELAEQNRWQELAQQYKSEAEALKADRDRATAYAAAIQATNEARIARIPEAQKALVPDLTDPIQLSTWLDRAESLLVPNAPKAPILDGGSGPAPKATDAPLPPGQQALVDMARARGYSVESDRIAQRMRDNR